MKTLYIYLLLTVFASFSLFAEERFSGIPIQLLVESLAIEEHEFSTQLTHTLEELKNNKLKEAFGEIEEIKSLAISDDQKKKAIVDYLEGVLFQRSGSMDKAIDSFLKSNEFFQIQAANDIWKWQLLNALGVAYWGNQEFTQAEIYLKSALALVKNASSLDRKIEAYTLNNLGLVELQNKPFDALISFESSLKIFEDIFSPDHIQVAFSNINISIAYRSVDNYLSAREYLEKAEQTILKVKGESSSEMAYLFSLNGKLSSLKGEEEQAIEFFEQSIAIYQKKYGNKHPEIAAACQEIALLKEKNIALKESLIWLNKAHQANHYGVVEGDYRIIPLVSTVINPMNRLVTLMLQARVFHALYENKTMRRRDLESSFNIYLSIDSLLTSLRQDRNSTADKLLLGQYAADVYPQAALLSLSLAEKSVNARFYKEKAFYFSEQLKSVVLKGAITATKALKFAGIPNAMLTQERMKKEEIARLENELYALEKDNIAIQNQLAVAKEDYQKFIVKLEQDYPKYYDLKYKSAVVTVDQLQNKLSRDQMLISYMFCEEQGRLITFYISTKSFDVYDAPLSPEIHRWLTGIRKGLLYDVEDVYRASAIELGKSLFPKKRRSSIKKLIIIPDAELAAIPFEALLLGKQQQYLIEQVSVSYDVSASLFLERKQNISDISANKIDNALLCAPVTFTNASTLLASEEEVNSLNDIFHQSGWSTNLLVRNKALEYTLKESSLQEYDILHFATHGIVNMEQPSRCALYLQRDQNDDGNLFASEIYNLPLNANLVTLSACETAIGANAKGEGIIGLSRAFMFAGARRMQVSLWTVSDVSTALLMNQFYVNFLKGNTPAESLRLAKIHLINHDEFQSPYFWAAFILIGD